MDTVVPRHSTTSLGTRLSGAAVAITAIVVLGWGATWINQRQGAVIPNRPSEPRPPITWRTWTPAPTKATANEPGGTSGDSGRRASANEAAEGEPRSESIASSLASPERTSASSLLAPEIRPTSVTIGRVTARPIASGAPRVPSANGTGDPSSGNTQNGNGSESGARWDRAPMPITQPDPPYPASARRRGLEGWVSVRVAIDRSGTVTQVEVIDQRGPELFVRSVRRTLIDRWKFQPAEKSGRAIASEESYRFVFDLDQR